MLLLTNIKVHEFIASLCCHPLLYDLFSISLLFFFCYFWNGGQTEETNHAHESWPWTWTKRKIHVTEKKSQEKENRSYNSG